LKRNAGEARIKGVVIILKGSNKQEKDFRDYENVSIGELETLKIQYPYISRYSRTTEAGGKSKGLSEANKNLIKKFGIKAP